MKRIRDFVVLAKKAGIELEVFLDVGIESEEGIQKWNKRRELEVLRESKAVPQGMTQLMADIFRLYDVKVFFSDSNDCDDCIASYAQLNGADILSNDGDFIRYTYQNKKCTFKVYSHFETREGELFIQTKYFNPKIEVKEREVIEPLPIMATIDPTFIHLQRDKIYGRGCPSGLVKLVGNIDIDAQPLRKQLYYNMGIVEPVKERFPI